MLQLNLIIVGVRAFIFYLDHRMKLEALIAL